MSVLLDTIVLFVNQISSGWYVASQGFKSLSRKTNGAELNFSTLDYVSALNGEKIS